MSDGIAVESVKVGPAKTQLSELRSQVNKAKSIFVMTQEFGFVKLAKKETLEMIESQEGIDKHRREKKLFRWSLNSDNHRSEPWLWIY